MDKSIIQNTIFFEHVTYAQVPCIPDIQINQHIEQWEKRRTQKRICSQVHKQAKRFW